MEFMNWYKNAPKLTKYYLTTVFVITLCISIKVLKINRIHLDFTLIFSHYQVILQ